MRASPEQQAHAQRRREEFYAVGRQRRPVPRLTPALQVRIVACADCGSTKRRERAADPAQLLEGPAGEYPGPE
jgi:hypothetical protein